MQSRAILHLILDGIIDRPDVVIFADTQQEPEHVYRAVQDDKNLSLASGLDFRIITWKDLGDPVANKSIYTPLFTKNEAGKKGQLLRSCTDKFKICPIRRELRLMGATDAEMWLGISTDEIQRMKPSNLKWIEMKWPLIDLGWNRQMCLDLLERKGVPTSRSACVFCPYRKTSEYEYLSEKDIKAAIDYDERIRHSRPGFECFIHSARIPLVEVLTSANTDSLDLKQDECSGTCWT